MFAGKVVIITGAGSGIGRVAAIKLASLGATVALTDINETALSESLSLCGSTAVEHMISTFDVGSTNECNRFVQDVVNRYGRIDYVLNNAGVNPTAMPTEDTPDSYWDKLVNTNLKGTFNISRACIPHLKAGASIINTSSIFGQKPGAGLGVYCATKYGIIGFTKSLALELGPRGIRVNAVAPGEIVTPTNKFVREGADAMESVAQQIGLRRMGQPQEVAEVIAFLFSESSSFMNGSIVEVNGGMA